MGPYVYSAYYSPCGIFFANHRNSYLYKNLNPGSSVLDVGSGSGYLTACFGHLVTVYSPNRNYRGKLRALKDKFGTEKTKLVIHGYTEYFSDVLSYIGVSDQEYEGKKIT